MLTLENYDMAVTQFLKDRYQYSVWGSPADAFTNAAIEFGDKTPLPLLSVYRSDMALDLQRFNFALMKKGRMTGLTDKTVSREKIIPFKLSYQFDIWAAEGGKANVMFCELLFRIMDNPAITVQHPGMEKPIINYLDVVEVVDNTDTSIIATRGRLARFTIMTQMNAHIAKLVDNDRIRIVPEFKDFSGKNLD